MVLSNFRTEIALARTERRAGRTPQQVRLFVIRQTGRPEIALRCEQAARYAAVSLQ